MNPCSLQFCFFSVAFCTTVTGVFLLRPICSHCPSCPLPPAYLFPPFCIGLWFLSSVSDSGQTGVNPCVVCGASPCACADGLGQIKPGIVELLQQILASHEADLHVSPLPTYVVVSPKDVRMQHPVTSLSLLPSVVKID